jgi:hypothetical protein
MRRQRRSPAGIGKRIVGSCVFGDFMNRFDAVSERLESKPEREDDYEERAE